MKRWAGVPGASCVKCEADDGLDHVVDFVDMLGGVYECCTVYLCFALVVRCYVRRVSVVCICCQLKWAGSLHSHCPFSCCSTVSRSSVVVVVVDTANVFHCHRFATKCIG